MELDTTYVAIAGIIQITLSILFIALSWWALQGVRWDLFLLNPNSPQAKIFVLLLSILIGAQVALFFSNYFNWSSWIKFLF